MHVVHGPGTTCICYLPRSSDGYRHGGSLPGERTLFRNTVGPGDSVCRLDERSGFNRVQSHFGRVSNQQDVRTQRCNEGAKIGTSLRWFAGNAKHILNCRLSQSKRCICSWSHYVTFAVKIYVPSRGTADQANGVCVKFAKIMCWRPLFLVRYLARRRIRCLCYTPYV